MIEAEQYDPSRQKIPELDGVRGLAIFLVLAVHVFYRGPDFTAPYFLEQVLIFGWTGVELFFVLSGFLITSILLGEKGKPAALRRFWINRAARVFPLYYTILALTLLASFVPLPELARIPIENVKDSIAIYALYLNNFADVFHFETTEGDKILGPAWSLAIEQHYYIFWPLVVLSMSRKGALIALSVLYGVSVSVRFALITKIDPNAIYHATPFHLDGIAIGSIFALLLPFLKRFEGYWLPALSISAVCALLVMVAAGTAHYSNSVIQGYGYTVISVTYAFLLLCSMKLSYFRRIFRARPLAILGKYSYSIYLMHWPLLLLLDQFTIPGGVVAYFIFLGSFTVLMTGLGHISWHLLEKPASVAIRRALAPRKSAVPHTRP